MKMIGGGMFVVFLQISLFTLKEIQGQEVATAIFDGKGIKGYINFTVVPEGVRIQTKVQGLVGSHRWHVHLFPVDQTLGPDTQCLGNYVGPHYDPFNENNGMGYLERCRANRTMCEAGDLSGKFGYLMNGVDIDVVDNTSTLFLRGRYSIVGRSVVIHSHVDPFPNFECATIRSMAEVTGGATVTVLQSTFVYPIAGVMYFKQVEGEEVQLWGKVFWVNGAATSMDHNWHIHQNNPGDEYRTGGCNITGNIGGHYRPFGNGPPGGNYNLSCNPDMLTGCEVGDLTGKHATINVPGSPSPYRDDAFFFTDSFLNLTGTYSVADRSIAIHEANRGGPVVACAPLIVSETITLRRFLGGEISISQTSPFEDTTITYTENRDMSVIQNSALAPLNVDCAGSSSLIFNAYPVQNNDISSDRFSTGALNNRYGSSTGTTRVYDLPVYGSAASISSLNIRTAQGNQMDCSALIPSLTESGVVIAKAAFGGSLRGAVYFIQRDYSAGQASSNLGNTLIIVDIYRLAESSSTVSGAWNIVSGTSASGCPSSAANLNPYNINTAGSDCTTTSPLRCAVGDLSGKHGTIDVGSNTTTRPTYTFVDNNLPLSDGSSVIGNSVRIPQGSDTVCGTITRNYISSSTFTVTVARVNTMTRALMADTMARVINVDSSDILVLSQSIADDSKCLEVSVQTLGTSENDANTAISMLTNRRNDIEALLKCSALSASTSVVVMVMSFLAVLISVKY